MAYVITNKCIGCDRCSTTCPTGAIQKVNDRHQIDPSLCNNCVGYYSVAQCAAACPTNRGCIPGTSSIFTQLTPSDTSTDYWDRWFKTYDRLISRLETSQHTHYWEHWFDQYSQRFSNLLESRNSHLSEAQS
jgi:Fe-S-cluster-containing dehydrogenase component